MPETLHNVPVWRCSISHYRRRDWGGGDG